MKLLSVAKDGGPESNVTGFFLVEIKSLFSIVFLKFAKGRRESFHSHAFNALTLYFDACVYEEFPDGGYKYWSDGWQFKTTPRGLMHRIYAFVDSYALSFRGPWKKTWQEYNPQTKQTITLMNGRKVLVRL